MVDAFSTSKLGLNPNGLDLAIRSVERALQRCSNTEGYLVILPSVVITPPRALTLFAWAIRSLQLGSRVLIWLQREAQTLSGINASDEQSSFRTLVVCDLLRNSCIVNGNTDDLPPGMLISGKHNDVALKPALHQEIERQYVDAIRPVIEKILTAPEVRLSPGPFLIEGSYYTDVFFSSLQGTQNPGGNKIIHRVDCWNH